VVDNSNQFCVVYKLKINNFRILLGAETDCFETKVVATSPSEEGPNKRRTVESYVELKTTKVLKTDKDNFNFQRSVTFGLWQEFALREVYTC